MDSSGIMDCSGMYSTCQKQNNVHGSRKPGAHPDLYTQAHACGPRTFKSAQSIVCLHQDFYQTINSNMVHPHSFSTPHHI